MSYTAWSVVFGEQPSASKWNILGTNDASFNDGTGIADDAIIARHIANNAISNAQMASDTWLWEELADVTLGAAADTLSTGTFTARKYLMILVELAATGGTLNARFRFNNDSGSNYTDRVSINGAADSTGLSQSSMGIAASVDANDLFFVGHVINSTSKEKLVIGGTQNRGTAGAGNAPNRMEIYSKWANTSVQITRVDVVNTSGTGDYAIGSRIVVLGHD